jgi:hypothetical protein
LEAARSNPKSALLHAYEEEGSSDSSPQKYLWLEYAAARLAAKLQVEVGNEDPSGCRLLYRLQAVGRSLKAFHYQTPKQTEELVELISKDYRSRLRFQYSGRLFTGLPSPFEYFEHRILDLTLEKLTTSSLESNWRDLDSAIKSDTVLCREYAILINRHASYVRADWHLNSFNRGGWRAKSLREVLNADIYLLRGISVASCITALALIWLGSQAGDGFLASILSVLLLAFCYGIVNRLHDRAQGWRNRAIADLTPFAQLETALHAAESESDLARCGNLAERLFEQGFVEMRYILCVLRAPINRRREDEA